MQLVGHQRPAHGRDDLVILKQVGQLAAGGPKLADIRFQRDQLLLHLLQLRIVEVVDGRRVSLAEAEHLGRHVHGGEVVPERQLVGILRIPKFSPGRGSFGKGRGVVEQGIRAPGEGHAVDLAVLLNQRFGR